MVVKRADDSFVLVGITSFGIGCSNGYPGVYSRVSLSTELDPGYSGCKFKSGLVGFLPE
ncbi:hypothetical protein LSH36_1069g00020 [Paralvinella palmiformis]|uniref:Uncharacterized protein n=1 Tax=Paralvinella palmiformis TaxID=53620 RepID=A0AAD9MPX3_9ANNE|nr:hypothetical protein LSH36_1069g00020 [Paralvinella palmiformis]